MCGCGVCCCQMWLAMAVFVMVVRWCSSVPIFTKPQKVTTSLSLPQRLCWDPRRENAHGAAVHMKAWEFSRLRGERSLAP